MTQPPSPLVFFNGSVVPWDQAQVHVYSETAVRGMNVFEGVRAYWNADRAEWRLLLWRQHLERLMESARILRLGHDFTPETFMDGLHSLLKALPFREDLYVRPTIYAEHGRYGLPGEDTRTGMYIVAFRVPSGLDEVARIRCCVSSWRRTSDLDVPPRVKSGASYQQFRLPKIEAARSGCDDAILLNARGTVAELTGAALFIVRKGALVSPPAAAGTLESLTRELVVTLARRSGMEFIEREVERTELYVASEVFATGSLLEIAAVTEIDGQRVGDGAPGQMTRNLAERYRRIARRQDSDYEPDALEVPAG